jgi:hypothetical protein
VIEASCHCGAVRIEIDSAPAVLTSCNCSICRRLGTLWAYYPPTAVRITGDTATYQWGERNLDFHHCPRCGCTIGWTSVDPGLGRMGVNARLMDPAVVAAVRVRRIDGANDTWNELAD